MVSNYTDSNVVLGVLAILLASLLTYCIKNSSTQSICNALNLTIAFHIRANGQHFFYCTLSYHLCFSCFVLNNNAVMSTFCNFVHILANANFNALNHFTIFIDFYDITSFKFA